MAAHEIALRVHIQGPPTPQWTSREQKPWAKLFLAFCPFVTSSFSSLRWVGPTPSPLHSDICFLHAPTLSPLQALSGVDFNLSSVSLPGLIFSNMLLCILLTFFPLDLISFIFFLTLLLGGWGISFGSS